MKSDYVVVIGGANIDITGSPKKELSRFDSAPGYVSLSYGGVGRNIAESISKMGIKTYLITCFGNDVFAISLKKNLDDNNIDYSKSITLDERSSCYLCLNNSSGDMEYAIAGMDILNNMTIDHIKGLLGFINEASLVVIDTNIPNIFKYAVENITTRIVVDSVSKEKAKVITDNLKYIYALKTNKLEAEAILGESGLSIDETCLKLLEKGLKQVYITMDSAGVTYGENGRTYHLDAINGALNTTGAGDSFTASLVYGIKNGFDIHKISKLGIELSHKTCNTYRTVCEKKDIEKLLESIND